MDEIELQSKLDEVNEERRQTAEAQQPQSPLQRIINQ